jgi:hypothetical protein
MRTLPSDRAQGRRLPCPLPAPGRAAGRGGGSLADDPTRATGPDPRGARSSASPRCVRVVRYEAIEEGGLW